MAIRPLNRYLLVEQDESEEISHGIAIISKKKLHRGKVATKSFGISVSVKVGDYVCYGDFAGSNEMKVEGKTWVFLHENDLLCVVENE